jgi:hypothetical protein
MGTDNPNYVAEAERDYPKVNVLCAVSTFKDYIPFFFSAQTVTGIVFLDMLTESLPPQLNEDSADFILQMDGAAHHFHRHVEFLNQHLPQRRFGRGTDDDQMLLAWPPRPPDATHCDFFSMGLRHGSGLCSSSHKYPRTEGTNQNRQ